MTHNQSVIMTSSYVVDDSILLHPLFVKWSALTFSQIVAARNDLLVDLGKITPTSGAESITAYLVGLLYIVGGASSGLLTAPA